MWGFNPLLLECLYDISEEMKASLFENENYADQAVVSKMTDELVIKQFRSEMPKEKNNESQNRKFFQEMTFEYDAFKDAVYISSQAAKDLGIDEIIYHPKNHEFSFFNKSTIKLLKDKLKETTHLNPEVNLKIYAQIGKQKQWYHLQASTRWNGSVYKGFVGKLVKDNNIQIMHNIQENSSLKYTYTEIKDFIEHLKDVFMVVRLIDFQKHQSAKAENDQIEIIEGNCYDYWKRKDVCVNCISKQAYIKKGQAFKLEFVDYDIYAIIAQYVEVDERPWVLELVYKTKEDIILGAHGKTRFLENIVTYNKEYYTDVLTGAYSRRYYEEYVQYINDVSAVAMIDADNFKAINDQYGHKKLQFTRVSTIKRIFNGNPTVESYLGKLLFNNMIPVPEGCYHEFNIFLEKDLKCKGLLIDQVQILRSFKNQEDILRRAQIVYKLKKRKSSYNYIKLATVDFELLERNCDEWNKVFIK